MSDATGGARARPRRVSPVPSLDAEERLQADGFAPLLLPRRLPSPHRRHRRLRAARPLRLHPRQREVRPVTVDKTIPASLGVPAYPGPLKASLLQNLSVVMFGRAVRASNDGFYTEAGWSAFPFRVVTPAPGMLSDITTARDHQTTFEEHMSKNCLESIPSLSVTVLTTGYWPSYKTCNINLPSEMIKCVEVFNNYYNEQQKHRKLNWIYSMGSCNIIAKSDTKLIELIVTTYQAALLLVFNASDRLTYVEIVVYNQDDYQGTLYTEGSTACVALIRGNQIIVASVGDSPCVRSRNSQIKCVEVFKNYYNEQQKHRKLNWIYCMGSCNIIAKFDTKPVELIVTTYQAALLLLFKESDRLSYYEIVTQLNLPDDDAVRLLQNHTAFHKALKEAFELFCNKDVAGCSSAESLAAFCDNILRKGGSEKLSDEAVEKTLDKVVNILTYIGDKDLFVEFHRKKLGKRLLFDKSVNNDHERSLLSKLKQYFGGQFTSKMEGILSDITTARDHQTKFEEHMGKNCLESIPSLSVTVLTTGYWPSYKTFNINLPSEMVPLPPTDDKKKVIDDVNKDRRLIDACIVRNMKKIHKVMGHQQLVGECVEQLSRMFKPDIKIIKRKIEDLISREYLERDLETANTYRCLCTFFFRQMSLYILGQ